MCPVAKIVCCVFVCRDLAAKADGKSDPFATLLFGKEQFSTQVRWYVGTVFDGNTSSPIPRPLLHGWESGNETPMQTTLC